MLTNSTSTQTPQNRMIMLSQIGMKKNIAISLKGAWELFDQLLGDAQTHADNAFRYESAHSSYAERADKARQWANAYHILADALGDAIFGKVRTYKCPACEEPVPFAHACLKHRPFCKACEEHLTYEMLK